jgi:hypothetical protein
MTQADDWEPVKYRNLPNWVKEASEPRRVVKKTYKTVLYGDPYDYLVQYTVHKEGVTVSYSRAAHALKKVEKPQKKFSWPSFRLLFGVLLLIVAGSGIVFLSQNLPVMNLPQPAVSPPPVASGVPVLSSTTLPVTGSLPPPTPVPANEYLQSPKTTSFSYVLNGDRRYLSFTTFGGFSDFLSNKTHSYHYDPETGIIVDLLENADQNEFMRPFLETIRKRSITPDDQARIAISLVQRIPTNGNLFSRTSTDWYYPYETLHNDAGSDADKSVLLAYILNELGFDTVLFVFSDHMAVGVKSSSRYAFSDTGYAFIETTRPAIISYVPDAGWGGFVLSQNPRIIHLSGGKRVMDVSTEYGDATRLKQLEGMGGNLTQRTRAELSGILDTYDLSYTPDNPE